MENIRFTRRVENDDEWEYHVRIGSDRAEHIVTVPKSYWEGLTGEQWSVDDLVHASYRFLLEREPKESILLSFNLHQIQQHFPEYEETMTKAVSG